MATTTTRRPFPSISDCSVAGRETHTIAADLDGTLLISPISFPYFYLVAVEAGSFLRGLLVLLASPIAYLAHLLLSDALAFKLMIFATFAGLRLRDVDIVARTVLPRFYAADVREEAWRVFRRCGRRVLVTANMRALVEPFAKGVLGADVVIGTELTVEGWTGRVKRPRLVGVAGGILVQPDHLPDRFLRTTSHARLSSTTAALSDANTYRRPGHLLVDTHWSSFRLLPNIELTDEITPVAVEAKVNMFYGSSGRGWKLMDTFFFFMNPRPTYEITFLDVLRLEQTLAAEDVVGRVQRLVGATLRFRCTSLPKEDKDMALGVQYRQERRMKMWTKFLEAYKLRRP